MALLALFAPAGSRGATQASHGGMDAMSIDTDAAGNNAASVGTIEQCARIEIDGMQNYDEDVTDGLIVDVTAQGIPAHNDNGTPGSPADDSGGIVGYQYTLNYPSLFTVISQEADDSAINVLFTHNASETSNDIFNASEGLPDDEGSNYNKWDSSVLDTSDQALTVPESGDGVLDRLTISADAGVGAGHYLLQLTENFHLDAASGGFAPHSTGLANIAVNQPCGELITSYGYYHPVTPSRILDTRTAPQGVGKVQANSEITVAVTGVGGVPATGVSAVVVNATVTEPTAPGSFLTVYPSDEGRPLASNLNFVMNQTVPNLVTVGVGPDGNVKVFNAAGETHVIFDVVGWYGAPAGGSLFNPLPPKRILDTRPAPFGPIGVPAAAKIGQNSTITVDVTDTYSSGVPASGVTAVVVNATVTEPAAPSYLTVYPADAPVKPTASNLNFVGGQTVPNLVIVKVGVGGANDGKVKIYNAVGSTHVIFDVVGWYGGATGDVFNPLPPSRVLDTRTAPQGIPAGIVQQAAEISVDVTVGSVPATASGVIVNTTVTEPTANSYMTVYPSNVSPPTASNLNFVTGQTVPNLVIVRTGPDGNVKLFNAVGQVHVIFDSVGYFAPVP